MRIPRYERAVTDKSGIKISTGGLGPKLLNVLSEHLDKRVGQMQNEEFVTHCADFDDQLREFEVEELNKTSHEADGAVQRASEKIETLAVEKKENFATYELADRFEVYAAARREGLLNRLARHQMVQKESALTDTINTMIESRSKTVYANPDEFVSELDMVKIDLDQLAVPNSKKVFEDIQASLVDHAVTGVIQNNPVDAKKFIDQHKKYITQNQIEKYHGYIRASETRIKAENKEAQLVAEEEVRSKLLPRVFSGEASVPEIDKADLPEREKMQWRHTLIARNKALAAGTENPLNIVDPGTDYQTMQDVYSNTPPSPTEIMMKVGHGLSIQRAEHWVQVLNNPDAGYKRALSYMKSQIAPKGGLMDPEDSDAADAYWRAVIALDNELAVQVEQGKPLRGNMILQKAMEITPDHKMTMREILDKKLEAVKSLAPAQTKKEEVSFWDRIKGWMESTQKPGQEEIDLLGQQIPLSDNLVGSILKSRGYAVNPQNIKTFRDNNGL